MSYHWTNGALVSPYSGRQLQLIGTAEAVGPSTTVQFPVADKGY
jgi:hypothetical protein